MSQLWPEIENLKTVIVFSGYADDPVIANYAYYESRLPRRKQACY